ncbi:MAG: DoxX family protein, partial [Planctomycetota bacterium]
NGIDGFAGYLAGLGVPLPTLNAYLAAGTEVVAGVAVALGLFTRLAAVPLVVTMAVAFFLAKGAALNPNGGGGEYALALGLVAVTLILTGPGRFNLTAPLLRGLAATSRGPKTSPRTTPAPA